MSVRRGARALFNAIAVVGLVLPLVLSVGPAQAADQIDTVTDVIWDVGDADATVGHTGELRALIWDIEEFDGRVYVAGKFLNVYAPNGDQFPQPYLAAFDLYSGDWIPSFQPTLRGPAYAIDITDDGVILAGGEIPGGLQAVDATTGADVRGFRTDIGHTWGTGAIFDVEIAGARTYIGGTFSNAGDQPLANLARVVTATGALDPGWLPTAQLDTGTPQLGGSNVFGIAVDQARDRVYLAGKFGAVNNNRSASYFATVNIIDGSLVTTLPQGLPPKILNHRESFSMWQYDVQFSADRVYLGGQAHQTLILDAETLLPVHSFFSNRGFGDADAGGDTQVIHVGKTTIWAGCHCWGSVGEYPLGSQNRANRSGQQSFSEYRRVMDRLATVPGSFGQQKVRGTYGIDIATGDLLPMVFDMSGQAGSWAILEDSNGRVWTGGQYTQDRSRGRLVRALARFAPPGAPTEAPPPNPPVEQAPNGFRTMFQTRDRLVFGWEAVDGAGEYEVLRNGEVVGRTATTFWSHRGLAPGTSGSYAVRAVLSSGPTPASEPINAATLN